MLDNWFLSNIFIKFGTDFIVSAEFISKSPITCFSSNFGEHFCVLMFDTQVLHLMTCPKNNLWLNTTVNWMVSKLCWTIRK